MIRVLIANVYFAPSSFGGATIVAEETARQLKQRGYLPLVVTSMSDRSLPDYHALRYQSKGLDVIAVNLPHKLDYEKTYKNSEFTETFREIVEIFKPDIMHLHSIQRMGAEIAEVAREYSIPYCITLHDCWWLCERQFMINREGSYCHQKKISKSVCQYCVDEIHRSTKRSAYLRRLLDGADRLFYPSRFHRDLHVDNNLNAKLSVVNRNGIRFPSSDYQRHFGSRISFGFVGGPGKIKGADVMLRAFRRIESSDYQLVVVDAAENIGRSWANQMSQWKIPGDITIANAYTQDTMDTFFSTINVLLFPSQWKESFGLTVREALARDVWVIATDGGGTVEDIRPGENGDIIPLSSDPRPLAEAIQRCIERDWSSYTNPYKADLQTYHNQAIELDSQFRDILGKHVTVIPDPACIS